MNGGRAHGTTHVAWLAADMTNRPHKWIMQMIYRLKPKQLRLRMTASQGGGWVVMRPVRLSGLRVVRRGRLIPAEFAGKINKSKERS